MTTDRATEAKQFAIVVDRPAHNGYPAAVDYVDARNPKVIGWRAVRFLLIVMVTIFGTFAGLYVMQAAFEPVSKVTSIPAPDVQVRK